MMNACIVALTLLAAAPAANAAEQGAAAKDASDSAAQLPAAERLPLYESTPADDARHQAAYALKARIRAALKAEATAEEAVYDEAVCELAATYCALHNEPPLAEDELLRLRTQVRSRLMKIAADLRRAEKRNSTAAKTASESLAENRKTRPASYSTGSTSAQTAVEPSAVRSIAGAAGGRAVEDHGAELVELIETVIAPNTWEKNGGFGSIFYYSPLRVIVVRSTGEVHRHVGDAIGKLRAAGP